MNQQTNNAADTQVILILAGTSSQYTEARRALELLPRQAAWLTRPSGLKGLINPKVYRFGSWRSLAQIDAIETALVEAKAEVIDL
jgi:hypothetical protein